MSTNMEASPETASMRSFSEAVNETVRERDRFMAQLSPFPHTFQLQLAHSLGNTKTTRLLSGLRSALQVGYKTQLETARAKNLVAFLLHCQDSEDEALEELDEVLEMEGQHSNLVTLANKAVILWHHSRLTEADELLDTLRQIQREDRDFEYLVVKAKAELAFTYTRLGPKFSSNAMALFREVIPEARESEKWLWNFGLGLTWRRLLRAQPHTMTPTPSPETVQDVRNVLQIFLDVTRNASCRNLQAKAYAEIATLLNMVWKSDAREAMHALVGLSPAKACEIALKLDNNDNSVLCKCGRIFRYIRRVNESRQLLEKALSIRPSSTGHHHLALTYKFLATEEKYKNTAKPSGYSGQRERQFYGGRPARNYRNQPEMDEAIIRQFRNIALGSSHPDDMRNINRSTPRNDRRDLGVDSRPSSNANITDRDIAGRGGRFNRAQPPPHIDAINANESAGTNEPLSLLSPDRNVRTMQKAFKSTPRGVTSFSRDDKYVAQALDHLERAVSISEGENTRALYDLAILQKALNELNSAMTNLQKMYKMQHLLFDSDEVNLYEQMGLIMRDLAESETNESKRQRLHKDSERMLLMALKSAGKIFAESPGVKENIREVWQSFPTLLQILEKSDKNPYQKLKEKAKLFQLIKDHKQTLNLLQQIEQMDPDRVKEPEYLKFCIMEYLATGQFEVALTFYALLECTPQFTETVQLFGDKHFVLKIYLHAARQALLQDNAIAKSHLRHVFQETAVRNAEEPSSSEDTDASEDSRREEETWDVTLLHEDDASETAVAMAEILNTFCGLRVPIMERDLPANRLDLEGVLRIMRRSSLVVVMAGHKPVSRSLRYYIRFAANRPSTVTLLVAGDHVPEMLRRHRSMACPQEVFALRDQEIGAPGVDALCNIFSFMVGVDMNKLNIDTSDP